MATTLIEKYSLAVGSGNDITLSITIGYAQLGSTTVSIGGKPYLATAKDENGNPVQPDSDGEYSMTFSLSLGPKTGLKDKKLVIVSSVERIQNLTDMTSVTIKLTGGASDSNYKPLKEKIDTVGDWLTYVGIITFTA